jgi:hypothetical protein
MVVSVPDCVSSLHVHLAQYVCCDCVPVCCTQTLRLSSSFLITFVVVEVMGPLPAAAHFVPVGYEYVGRLPSHGAPHAPESVQSEHLQSTGLEHVEVASLQPVSNPPGV